MIVSVFQFNSIIQIQTYNFFFIDMVVSTSSGSGYHLELSKQITLCTVNPHGDNSMWTSFGNWHHPAHVCITLLCTQCLYAGIGSSTLFSYFFLVCMGHVYSERFVSEVISKKYFFQMDVLHGWFVRSTFSAGCTAEFCTFLDSCMLPNYTL